VKNAGSPGLSAFLVRAGVGARALEQPALFQRVAEHREILFRFSWVDYTTHRPGTFRLLPPIEQMPHWRSDCQVMLGPMLFGDTPKFEDLMATIREFESAFNATRSV